MTHDPSDNLGRRTLDVKRFVTPVTVIDGDGSKARHSERPLVPYWGRRIYPPLVAVGRQRTGEELTGPSARKGLTRPQDDEGLFRHPERDQPENVSGGARRGIR